MAGRGPAPKATRARRNAPPTSERVVQVTPSGQPDLPDQMPTGRVDDDGNPICTDWPSATVTWWKQWAEHPLAAEFTSSDWSFMLDTAVLHGAYWSGDLKVAGELRLRVAKVGATPEDRARLRITFATADDTEAKAKRKVGPSAESKPAKKRPDPRTHLSSVS